MILEKSEKILEKHSLCNNCLGRLFGRLGKSTNYIRGKSIRLVLNMKREAEGLPTFGEPEKCELCGNIFKKTEYLARLCYDKAQKLGLEFESFLVGSRFPKEILEKEKQLWEEFGLEFAEPINRELNREVGKFLEVLLQKPVNKEDPDVVFIIDPYNERTELQIKPLYIYGRYRKLVRGIPQTPLKGFRESVASIICRPFAKVAKGKCIFHGAGREDVDVRMLGNGRPFIVEIKNPIKRKIDLRAIAQEINQSKKVEVLELKFISRTDMERILTSNHKKEYEALVYVEEGITLEDIRKIIEKLRNCTIYQRTPRRVLRRRADIVRVRRVYDVSAEIVDKKHLKLRLITDGGLYIKELISGDNGRTTPSVSEILGKKAWCEKLDVLNILDD
ncbi:tRNA pseudouridine(54/55) synthase Pus10 [Thermococcus barophilus]|uniref:tRNA pseudouridine synthase Pus10 n=1 Tax=Thermococcus barophilus TaxID=55802 RepID=A0A0S1X9L3_THEBA|nr:tRNA pseudouridine(54/55) synthase Pus10 [Thermococcus barophilus]ALM74420.1 tRNA pseudouridine synthase Pus10 [Thermococcus barophilus]